MTAQIYEKSFKNVQNSLNYKGFFLNIGLLDNSPVPAF